MTAQFPERLICYGEEMNMYSEPLSNYLIEKELEAAFVAECSALWRGYLGTWEIIDGKLFLVSLTGNLSTGAEASISSIFPETSDKVFANWYSGDLKIPRGDLVEYIHMGFDSKFESELVVKILSGYVVATRLYYNKQIDKDDDGLSDKGLPF